MSGLKAIQSTVDEDEDFNKENLEIATLGEGSAFRYLNNEEIGAYLEKLKNVNFY